VATELDPSAERLMRLSSELISSRDQVRRLRKRLWALMAVLHAERVASASLLELLDELLSDERDG
jgi:hypothetical protein